MKDKFKIIEKIHDRGIVAVVRANNGEEALKISEAASKGGVDIIEITMTVPGAVDVIKELTEIYENKAEDIIIGAGSVLDSETARACILAGAEFIVGPSVNKEMINICNKYDITVAAGAMTPTEAVNAMEMGADIIKVFPAGLFGPSIIKAIKGPIPQARLLPTGGVDQSNVKKWIEAGSFAVGAGSAICAGAKTNNYEKVTKDAEEFVKKIEEARQ